MKRVTNFYFWVIRTLSLKCYHHGHYILIMLISNDLLERITCNAVRAVFWLLKPPSLDFLLETASRRSDAMKAK